jgi:hypothetical protein
VLECLVRVKCQKTRPEKEVSPWCQTPTIHSSERSIHFIRLSYLFFNNCYLRLACDMRPSRPTAWEVSFGERQGPSTGVGALTSRTSSSSLKRKSESREPEEDMRRVGVLRSAAIVDFCDKPLFIGSATERTASRYVHQLLPSIS